MLSKNPYLLITATLVTIFAFTIGGCGDDSAKYSTEKKSSLQSASDVKNFKIPMAEPGDMVAGKLIYEKHCHYCHGKNGRGKGAVAIAITPNPADFISDKKRMAVTDEMLYKSLSYGITDEAGGPKLKKALAMPPFMGVLTPKQRWDVIAYVRDLIKRSTSEEKKR